MTTAEQFVAALKADDDALAAVVIGYTDAEKALADFRDQVAAQADKRLSTHYLSQKNGGCLQILLSRLDCALRELEI